MKSAVLFLLLIFCSPLYSNWIEQHKIMGDGNDMLSVSGSDCNHIVVVGVTSSMGNSTPVAFYTEDGGDNWNQGAISGQFAFIMKVKMLSQEKGFGIGLGFFKTTNGGKTFVPYNIPQGATFYNAIFFLNKNKGFLIGDGNKFYITTDGENFSYFQPNTDVDTAFNDLFFFNDFAGWIVGGKSNTDTGEVLNKGAIIKTTDGGNTFETLVQEEKAVYTKVVFLDNFKGFVLGYDESSKPFVKFTDDGGKTFKKVELPPHPSGKPIFLLSTIVFTDSEHGWIFGGAGTKEGGFMNVPVILKTDDGGKTFYHDTTYNNTGGVIYDAFFCNQHIGYAVGNYGKIEKFDDGEYIAPENEGQDTINEKDAKDAETFEAGVWKDVFASLNDGSVPSLKNSENSSQDNETTDENQNNSNFTADVSSTQNQCKEVTINNGSGCSIGKFKEKSAETFALFLAGLLIFYFLLKKKKSKTHFISFILGIFSLFTIGFCQNTTTERVCITPDSYTKNFSFDAINSDEKTDFVDTAEKNTLPYCVVTKKPAFSDSPKSFDVNNYIAFARKKDEIDNVFLLNPKTGEEVQLSKFETKGTFVKEVKWSNSRRFIAFVSNANNIFSENFTNIFMIDLDSLSCFSIAPDNKEGVYSKPADDKEYEIVGFFKGASEGIIVPIKNGTVSEKNEFVTVNTGEQGNFKITLHRRNGTLIFRGNGEYENFSTKIAFEISDNELLNLGDVVAKGDELSGEIKWFVFSDKEDTIFFANSKKELISFRMNTGEFDNLTLPDLTPEEEIKGIAILKNRFYLYTVYDNSKNRAILYIRGKNSDFFPESITLPGFAKESKLIVSPAGIAGYVGANENGKQVFYTISSDKNGNIKISPFDLFGNYRVKFNEVDWSLNGTSIVATTINDELTNLVVFNINTHEIKELTNDGVSHDPSWAGN